MIDTKNKYTDFVLILGDLQDHFELSRFSKDPNQRRYRDELDDVNVFFDAIQKQFPKAQIIWKLGNHEFRLHNFLRTKAPELFDMEKFIIYAVQLALKSLEIIPRSMFK